MFIDPLMRVLSSVKHSIWTNLVGGNAFYVARFVCETLDSFCFSAMLCLIGILCNDRDFIVDALLLSSWSSLWTMVVLVVPPVLIAIKLIW